MEPQENVVYCYNNKEERCSKRKNCLSIVAIILLAAFTLVIGIIIGAALSATILASLAAIIVLAVILGLLLILATILIFCCNKKKDKKCKCC